MYNYIFTNILTKNNIWIYKVLVEVKLTLKSLLINRDYKVFILLINNNVKIIITLKLYHKKKMPQLVPFYFINQVTFAFILLIIMIYVFSKYILPRFVRLFISRIYISKL